MLQRIADTEETLEVFLSKEHDETRKALFRNYEKAIVKQPSIAWFYKENHERQTLEHVLAMKAKYGRLDKAWMGVWEVLEIMDGLVDDADPDSHTSEFVHAIQTAEIVRRDGQPRWLILTALIHDLGKLLYFMGEPQWTVTYFLV